MTTSDTHEDAYRTLVEHSLQGLVIYQNERIVFANHRAAELLGYTVDELLALSSEAITDLNHPDDRAWVRQRAQARLRGEAVPERYEVRLIRKDGSVRWVDLRASRIEYHSQPAIQTAFVDITERKQAEALLQVSEERYRSMIAGLSEGIVLQSADGVIRACNVSAERILGLTADQMMGRTSLDPRWRAIHEDGSDFPGETHPAMLTLRTGQPQFNVIMGVHKPSGELTWISINTQPIIPAGETQPYTVVASFHDITASKRAQAELAQQNRQLAALNQVGQALSQLAEPNEILERIYSAIGQVLDNRNLYIALYDEATQYISFPIYTIGGQRRANVSGRVLGNGITDYIIRTKQPLLIWRDLDAKLIELGIALIGALSQCFLGVPMLIGAKIIGVLAVQDYEREAVYDETHLALLTTFAAEAAVALENARLYAAAQRELAAREKAQAALQDSERRFRALIEHSADGILLLDQQGIVTYRSPTTNFILGYTVEENIGRNIFELIHPDDHQHAQQLLRQLLQKPNANLRSELRIQHKDGAWRVIESTATNLLAEPSVQAIIVNFRDVTERKQAENALRQSEERYRSLAEAARDMIFIINLDGTVAYVNRFGAQQFGWRPEDIIGRRLAMGFPPEITQRMQTNLQKAAQALEPIYVENIVPFPRGEAWLGMSLVALKNEVGDTYAVLGIARDITERKRAEQERRAHEQFLTALHDITRAALQTTELQAMLQMLAERLRALLGADHCFITTWNEATQLPQNSAAASESRDVFLATQVQPDDITITASVLQLQRTLVIPDVFDTPYFSPHIAALYPVRSALAIPLSAHERKLGALIAGFNQPHDFSPDEIARAEQAAAQVALAIAKARLLNEAQRRNSELSALYETTRDITTQHDLPALLQTIAERAQALLAAPVCSIFLYDAQHDELERTVALGLTLPLGERSSLGSGLSGWVAHTRQSLRLSDYQRWEHRKPSLPDLPLAAALSVPMLSGGELIGVVNVAEFAPSLRQFTEADEHLLSLFASQAAIAVHNARLLHNAHQRLVELEAINQISLALRTAATRVEMLPIILDQVMAVMQAEGASLSMRDPHTRETVMELTRGAGADIMGRRYPEGMYVQGRVIMTGQPYLNNHVQGDLEAIAGPEVARYFNAVACVPLTVKIETIGTLWVGRKTPIRDYDVRLLNAIADIAANAIQRTTLHEQTQQRAEQLAAINELGRVLAMTLELPQIYAQLYATTIRLLPDTATLFIALFDAQRELITGVFGMQDGQRVNVTALPPIPLSPPGEGAQSEVIHTRQPLIVSDLEAKLSRASPLTLVDASAPDGRITQAALYVPMLAKGAVIGVVQAQSYTRNRYTVADADLLTVIANTAAIAIQNARLFAETERRLAHMQALRTIDMAISNSLDLRLTLNILLEQAMAQLRFDAADILLADARQQHLTYEVGRGFRTTVINRTRLRLGEGVAGRAALERRTLHVPDLTMQSAAFVRTQLRASESFISYCATPLIAKGKIKGVLECFYRAPFTPEAEWLNFFESLAAQAAIAIDNMELFIELQRSNSELVMAYDTTLEGWSRALDLRDKETEGHTQRVTELTMRLAEAMGFSAAQLVHARRGALLHDIGKMGVPDGILLKPGALDEAEWVIMKKHPTYAYELLLPITFLREALDIPYCHHEKWDGTGYPRGLKGEQIPLAARIFAIVDVWDALRSDRPYRAGWLAEKVRDHIRKGSGTHFDPKVVEVFLEMVEEE
jgi:PAS domain S-box-containing protein/putative nucleotidyltransferase with HDIG domain